MKTSATEFVKIFATHETNKYLIFRIYKYASKPLF